MNRMHRDLVLHQVIGVNAQLKRLERLANSINDPTELKARLPPLITLTCKNLNTLMNALAQREGGGYDFEKGA